MFVAEAWCAADHGVSKSQTQLSKWAVLNSHSTASPPPHPPLYAPPLYVPPWPSPPTLPFIYLPWPHLSPLFPSFYVSPHGPALLCPSHGQTPPLYSPPFYVPPHVPFSLYPPMAPPLHSSVQSLSCVWLIATPWIAACQASLSITNSWSPLKLMSIELVVK